LHIGSGIGEACAIGLAKEGAVGVLIGDINLEAATKTVADCQAVATNSSFRAEAVKIDVTDETSVRAFFARAVELFERVDYAVSCAGVSTLPITYFLGWDLCFVLMKTLPLDWSTIPNRHCVPGARRVPEVPQCQHDGHFPNNA
jgi:NAD(P)-dependent dehydrogenase (short-subunit alcohol dehydrogenase family)